MNKQQRFDGYGATAVAILALGAGLLTGVPAQAQANKTVTIVVGEEPEDLDPCSVSSSFTGRIIHQNVVEALAELKPDGSIVPRLATGWQQTDDLTWRFKLREGVTYHDGAKLNADTVVRAFERINDGKFTCMVKNKYFSAVKFTVSKIDNTTVNIVTSVPWPIVPLFTAGLPIPSPNTPMDKLQLSLVGSGPYVFDKWQQQQEIVLRKNPAYWNRERKLDVENVRYLFRKESSVRAAMVAIGEADREGLEMLGRLKSLPKLQMTLFESVSPMVGGLSKLWGMAFWRFSRIPKRP